jgi:UDP-N-acetylmuramoyl-L-alanyl-D-glutamate--2,6-diaminopimelate ligase
VPGYPRPRSVRPTPLGELAALLGTTVTKDGSVTGVTLSSRSVQPGDLYAALPGSRAHGAEFAGAAAQAGAAAILTDPTGAGRAAATGLPTLVVDDPRLALGEVASHVYGRPTAKLSIVGITGTAGKTSTVYLVEAGLRAAGRVTGLIGTVETRMGDVAIASDRTTPEATDLHALFAVALEQGVQTVAMEVSSHALQLGRVGGVQFAVGGFTNLGLDHLDFHADVEEYFAAKAKLFDGRSRVEIVNRDDPAGRKLLKPGTLTFSAAGDEQATWRATDVRATGFEQTFIARGPDGLAVETGVRLPGRHNVANALLAVACLVAVGVDPALAGSAVAAATGAPGRMERVDPPELASNEQSTGILGIVDYAHKPDAIVEVLAALHGLVENTGGRVICVIGAGGDRDTGKRPLMGAAAAGGADIVLVTDDNPRTEDPAAIRAQVLDGTAGKGQDVAGRRAAIDQAVALARPGDIIALLGKGHESGQEVNGEMLPFDDRTELAAALTARFKASAVR